MQACFIVFFFFTLWSFYCCPVYKYILIDFGMSVTRECLVYIISACPFLASLKDGSQLFKSVFKQVIETAFAGCNLSYVYTGQKNPS